MAKAPAIVLSSGGLHSLICAGLAQREFRIAMLHLRDGRVAKAKSEAAFEKQVMHFKPIKNWVVEAGHLRQMALPDGSVGTTFTSSDPQAALIPFRALHFLIVAAGFARQIKAEVIFWGVQIDPRESDQLAKTLELIQIFNQMMEVHHQESPIQIKTPLVGVEDPSALELANQMSLPLAASWTCHNDFASPCMGCSSCVRRLRSFRLSQLVDPLLGAKKGVSSQSSSS